MLGRSHTEMITILHLLLSSMLFCTETLMMTGIVCIQLVSFELLTYKAFSQKMAKEQGDVMLKRKKKRIPHSFTKYHES